MSGPIRQAAWRLILPEIRKIVREEIADQLGGFRGEVQGEFKAVHSEIRRLDEKIESTDAKIDSVKDQLQDKIESVGSELGAKIDGLEKRMDLVQQVAVLQSKVSDLEAKLHKAT